MKVQRTSLDPMYRQIADLLRQRIEVGQLLPGMAIPPESELIRTLDVSRVTVRQAIDLLVSEALVVRKQGKGTFVCPPRIREDLRSLQGLAELLAARGAEQSMEVVGFGWVAAPAHVAEALGLTAGAQVLRIRRRHWLKGVPVAVAEIYLDQACGARIEREELASTPIYTLLEQRCQVRIKRAGETIRAEAADRDTADLLNLPRGVPVLAVRRTTYSAEELPVEYIEFRHRHDSYEIAVELQRDSAITHEVKRWNHSSR